MLNDFLNIDITKKVFSCEGYVGTGKTASGMIGALQLSNKLNKRKIFWVVPYTSIIDQHVQNFRESVVLEGESPEEIVAAHYHSSEYVNSTSGVYDGFIKQINELWNSPIVITTAVQFFETLSTNRTGKLRKLNQVANSVILIDESHM